jgi:hypothetical protein
VKNRDGYVETTGKKPALQLFLPSTILFLFCWRWFVP